jgi:molybdopterin-guanine dinucleotide biosynthesis protein MobB
MTGSAPGRRPDGGTSHPHHQEVVVICVRGPSRSGKTAICERISRALATAGERIGYVKRTHHPLDLPQKASGRVWASGAAAMVLRSTDRIQVTLPPEDADLARLLALLPPSITVALIETHEPEPYPTVLAASVEPLPDERVLARWSLDTIDHDAGQVMTAVVSAIHDWRRRGFNPNHGCSVAHDGANTPAFDGPGVTLRP